MKSELEEAHRKLSRQCSEAKTNEELEIILEKMRLIREKIKENE